ncbi:hypothetical protein FXO37_20346 [Capsicum annuum]|nr:hypothetical protein FXO37_20346 [Capsicum annuum]
MLMDSCLNMTRMQVSDRINCGVCVFTSDIFTVIQGVSTQRKDRANLRNVSSIEALQPANRSLPTVQLDQDILTPLAGKKQIYTYEAMNFREQIRTPGTGLSSILKTESETKTVGGGSGLWKKIQLPLEGFYFLSLKTRFGTWRDATLSHRSTGNYQLGTGLTARHIEITLQYWMGPGISPRRGSIVLRHWKGTILNLSLGATCHNCGGSLEFDDCYFGLLHDTLMAQMAHCLTKMALSLRSSVEIGRIWTGTEIIAKTVIETVTVTKTITGTECWFSNN